MDRSWGLSTRQLQVAECIAEGMDYPAIAAEYALAVQTVKNMALEIRRAMGVGNNVALALKWHGIGKKVGAGS